MKNLKKSPWLIRGAVAVFIAISALVAISGVQEAIRRAELTLAAYLPNSTELLMIKIKAGSFMMGSPVGEEKRDYSETQHKVTLTKDYWLGKYEVTQEQYQAVMGTNPSRFKGSNLPVEAVSCEDAMEFCKKLNELTEGKRPQGYEYSLPTEAQWEYACRAGTTTAYSWGNSLNGDNANCDGNYPYGTTVKGPYLEKTSNVGNYAPNAWGLYDMHGNVWEWCKDRYGEYGGAVTDPQGHVDGSYRVLRGGSWNGRARNCRSASRGSNSPGNRSNSIGFRVALVPVL